MEQQIIDWCENNNYLYIKIETNEEIKKIYDLIIDNKYENPVSIKELLYYGLYYKIINDYENMLKYYLIAINNGCIISMTRLARHYEEMDDYKNMLKYYLMAIDNGSVRAMFNLGSYYQHVSKDYENMLKYYFMAIDNGYNGSMYDVSSLDAMHNLGYYYQYVFKDYDNMMKYYLMVINNGCINPMYNLEYVSAMNNLGSYYQYVKDYDNMIKYYLMAIDHGSEKSLPYLGYYYKNINDYENLIYLYHKYNKESDLLTSLNEYLCNNTIDYDINNIPIKIVEIIKTINIDKAPLYLKLVIKSINTQIDLLDTHYKYMYEGTCFEQVKNDYFTILANYNK